MKLRQAKKMVKALGHGHFMLMRCGAMPSENLIRGVSRIERYLKKPRLRTYQRGYLRRQISRLEHALDQVCTDQDLVNWAQQGLEIEDH